MIMHAQSTEHLSILAVTPIEIVVLTCPRRSLVASTYSCSNVSLELRCSQALALAVTVGDGPRIATASHSFIQV